ncbi:RHS repeat domain-containing protein, partial [uncultured Winogradskyella sp.]|uniref:RHS repeat domain-containing protein n=1 Tax=uncultured Winogradskyella sp. TaxID=395353 RepID=UPI002616F791
KVRVLGTTEFITSVTHYDDKARPINIYSKNPYLGTVDEVKSQLAFDGTVTETTTTHSRTGFSTITTVDVFSYDHMNRLIDQQQSINSGTAEVIVENTYDELGQLESKGVGGTTAQSRLQTVDYTYNIRGWLKEINDVANLGTDLFGFKINYNEQEGAIQFADLYNGNISQTIWKTANDNEKRGYSYEYDDLNRIDRGIMRKGDNLDVYTRHHLRSVSYDKNGNIVALQRDSNVNIMDDLTYTYDGNQLLSVTDANTTHLTEGFIDGNTSGNDYTYDANGNMLRDYNKGISSNILYNHLNLPTQVTLNGGNIQYIYDATGVKQKKIVSNGTTTYYAGNYIYEGSSLKFFSHPEGYIEPNGSNFDYVYQYKDHLGNIRLAYSDTNNNGSVNASEIIEENNYYPFGLKHKGYNNVVNGTDHKWGYLNQEENDELGLGWLTFRYRNYIPEIGRFFGTDPISEEFMSISTYQIAHNNPIWKIEIEGLEGETHNKEGKGDIQHHEPVKRENRISRGTPFVATGTGKVVQETTKQVVTKTSWGARALGATGRLLGNALIYLMPTSLDEPQPSDFMDDIKIDEKFRPDDKQVRNQEEEDKRTPIKRIRDFDGIDYIMAGVDSYENPGHHDPSGGPNPYNSSKSVLPNNHEDLWQDSVADPKSDNTRWTKEGSGKKAVYHRFQSDGNGNWHWNGSTNGRTKSGNAREIRINHVPNEIKKL